MKRLLCLVISIALVLTTNITVFATESDDYKVKTINVEYSDNVGSIEKVSVIEKENHVYVSAEELSQRLGYQCSVKEDHVTIYNVDNHNIPIGFTVFYYDSTKVEHMLFSIMSDAYEAPISSIKDGENAWIPLEYALLILGSSMSIVDDTLLIDMPQKSIVDIFYDVMKNNDRYQFEWEKDFGYSESAWKIIGGSSHLINLFNGVLKFDGASWMELFQSLALDSSSYDSKYGENLALLICTESDKELKAESEKITQLQDLLTSDGKIGKMLSTYSESLDSEVGAAYKTCESILQEVESGNSTLAQYNKSYQALEKALDKQTWFSDTGGTILEVQKGVSNAIPILDVGLKVLEVVGYASEFEKQDEFSVAALAKAVSDLDEDSLTFTEMKGSMADYTEKLQSNVVEYSARRYFDENVDSWIKSALGVTEALGTQANIELLAWSLASSYIPRISDSLSAADDFELALYTSIFGTDAYLDYQNLRNKTFEKQENVTAENLYQVSQYCYIYLKSCYITRDAALGSLKGKSYSTQEEIQSLIDQQNQINDEIAEILVLLKDANKTNEGLIYGFLPRDNQEYLTNCDETKLVDFYKNSQIATDVRFNIAYTEDNAYEYATIQGLDENGNIVWDHVTEKYEIIELELLTPVGINEDYYVYVEGDKVVGLKLSGGSVAWINSDFSGGGASYTIGPDKTIYLCGYYGPDFYAINKFGETLIRIDSFDENYYWPYMIEFQDDQILVYMDGSDTGYDDGAVFIVDPSDFSFQLRENTANTEFTEEELIKMAKIYYEKRTGNKAPEYINVSTGDSNIVTIHLYDIVDNGPDDQHTVTHDWYYVDCTDATGENLLGEYIDLKNP